MVFKFLDYLNIHSLTYGANLQEKAREEIAFWQEC